MFPPGGEQGTDAVSMAHKGCESSKEGQQRDRRFRKQTLSCHIHRKTL